MSKRIAILAANDFKDVELTVPLERLREAGYDVSIVGPTSGTKISDKDKELKVPVDLGVADISVDDFDALIIPGGYSPDNLRLNADAVKFTREFGLSGKPVAAICHGPQLLISADLVRKRTLTCWPSITVDIVNAGGNYVDQPIVVDHNLITSRKPSDLPQFVDAIISAFDK